VLALIAALFAAVAPRLQGFGRGQHADNAAEMFLAATDFARAQAVADGLPHRLELVDDGAAIAVSRLDAATYVPVEGGFGAAVTFGGDATVAINRADASNVAMIDFLPDGTLTPGTIVASSADGERSVVLRARGVADPFRRVPAGEVP